jgi:hypothetical protein
VLLDELADRAHRRLRLGSPKREPSHTGQRPARRRRDPSA